MYAKISSFVTTIAVCALTLCALTSATAGESFDISAPVIVPQRTSIDIRPPEGRLPDDLASDVLDRDTPYDPSLSSNRLWAQMSYQWKAPAVPYRPLYFEEDQLERYGHHHGIAQPVISATKFFGRIPLVPYMVGATPCHECQYSLGYFRPGDCVPLHITHPKASARGAIYEAAAITGGVFLIP